MERALKNRHLVSTGQRGSLADGGLSGLPSADIRKLLKWIRSRGMLRVNELPSWHLESIRESGVDRYIADIRALERIRAEFKPVEPHSRRASRRL